jgi:hypothetical protein
MSIEIMILDFARPGLREKEKMDFFDGPLRRE